MGGDSRLHQTTNSWRIPDPRLALLGLRAQNKEGGHELYKQWSEYSSAPRHDVSIFYQDKLREIYPNHSVLVVQNLNVLNFPDALAMPIPDVPANVSHVFVPLPRRLGPPGVLLNQYSFGAFKVAWKEFEFTVYAVSWLESYVQLSFQAIVFDGPESTIQAFAVAAGAYANELHEEIYVFNQYWEKDHQLWLDVQKADWNDVILKDELKNAFRSDIDDFFKSEDLYKEYAIPWKRGIIMHGPPGNGKTISMKAVMKYSKYPCLYVRSFQTWMGEEAGMSIVFEKARLMAPCILVLEDLDTLITPFNRSFFLNQLDGLSGNDGLLLLATTNHLDKIDPSLSQRPSRFDRKYLFDDPDADERRLYCIYWQNKLKENKKIDFPESLIDKIVKETHKFSFAYLKEVFVSSLVLLAGANKEKSFEEVIMGQIKLLKKGVEMPYHSEKAEFDWNMLEIKE